MNVALLVAVVLGSGAALGVWFGVVGAIAWRVLQWLI